MGYPRVFSVKPGSLGEDVDETSVYLCSEIDRELASLRTEVASLKGIIDGLTTCRDCGGRTDFPEEPDNPQCSDCYCNEPQMPETPHRTDEQWLDICKCVSRHRQR
jgi:hypothetical protein